MRIIGTFLMLIGAFAIFAAGLSLFGSSLPENGVMITAYVTSVPRTLIGGALALLAGAWLRRRAGVRSRQSSPQTR